MTLRAVRAALAIAAVLLLLTSAVAPHVHEGPLGAHACLACAAAGGEEAAPQTPDVAPRALPAAAALPAAPAAPVTGKPLGAVSGQSPPARA